MQGLSAMVRVSSGVFLRLFCGVSYVLLVLVMTVVHDCCNCVLATCGGVRRSVDRSSVQQSVFCL